MKPWKGLTALTTLVLVLPLAVHAQRSDPEVGTWKLNLGKSKFDPGPAPTSETRTYVMTADGIQMTDQIVTAAGDTQTRGWTLKRDGKPYQETGNPNYDALAATRVSPLHVKSNLIRVGQTVGHADTVESRNHKTLTIDVTYTNTTGQAVHNVEVFDRQ